MSKIYTREALAYADQVFDVVDLDGNGVVDFDEMRQYLRTRGYTDTAVNAVFRGMDANSDGELSRTEFEDGFTKYALVRQAVGALVKKLVTQKKWSPVQRRAA